MKYLVFIVIILVLTDCTKDKSLIDSLHKNLLNSKGAKDYNLNDQILVCQGWDPVANVHEIFTYNIGTQEVRQLTNNYITQWKDGRALSPDGKKLAFAVRTPGAWSGLGQIYVMNIDGSNLSQLTFEDAIHTTIKWHPNGKSIFYSYSSNGQVEDDFGNMHYYNAIYQQYIDETEPILIIDNSSQEINHLGEYPIKFDISPNGQKMLVSLIMNNYEGSDIYEINLHNLKYKNLTNTSDIWENKPQYCKKTNVIAFVGYAPSWDETILYTLKNRKEWGYPTENLFDSREINEFAVSNDGNYIVYSRKEGVGNGSIYVLDVKSSEILVEHNLVDNGYFGGLHFMEDNKNIAHFQILNSQTQVNLFMLNLDGAFSHLLVKDFVQGFNIYGEIPASAINY